MTIYKFATTIVSLVLKGSNICETCDEETQNGTVFTKLTDTRPHADKQKNGGRIMHLGCETDKRRELPELALNYLFYCEYSE